MKELSKTWIIQRLKHIDLSAVPNWISPFVSTASRYQHSRGVGNLSLQVSGGTKHEKLLLTAAAILHDVGDGPFPHISDQIMKEKLGFTHEGALKFAFENSPVKDHSVLDRYNIDIGEISSVLEGKHHISPLLYGFPDLDNADNIYRFMLTIPSKHLGESSYLPSEISKSMSLKMEELAIPYDLRKKWLTDYKKVYHFLWNDYANMIGWTMLGRALRIQKEYFTPNFFRLTNREAYKIIKQKLPKLTIGLMRGEFTIIFDRKFKELKGEAKKLIEINGLMDFESMLCREASLENWTIGLTVDQPLINENTDHWRVYLVSYKGNEKAKRLVEETLSKSNPLFSKRKDHILNID
jgi:hypothetical protein